MKSLLKCFVAVVATSLLAVSTRAEEKGSSVMTALSSTVLSGYVDTSAQWNVGSANTVNVPPAYLEWLIAKRQAALNAFNQEYVATGGYWGNSLLLQARLNNFHLVRVWWKVPIPSPPSITLYTYVWGYAYFDSPSWLAGPGGTQLMPDLQVIRMPARSGARRMR